jgi:hypothetical protein
MRSVTKVICRSPPRVLTVVIRADDGSAGMEHTMSYQHAIVWIDHQHATVIDFALGEQHTQLVEREGGQRQVHRKSGLPGSGKAADDHQFYDTVATAIGTAREILIVGPGQAKLEFRRDLEKRHRTLFDRVVGTESLDHPNNSELLTFGRKYFKRVDALRGDT